MNEKTTTRNQKVVRGAMLIALAVVLQALRLVIPLPRMASAFLIGTLMHMMLTFSFWRNGKTTALFMAALLPVFAYLQGQIIIHVLVPVVLLGNVLFVNAVAKIRTLWLAPVLKTAFMAGSAYCVLQLFEIGPQLYKPLLFSMSVPQLVTGYAGIWLAKLLDKKIAK